MARKSRIVGITLVAALTVPSFAAADNHRMRGHGGGQGMTDRIETFDRDGNGEVTQAEIDATRAERLANFDANADGMLDIAEYEALWLDAMRERMVDMFQRHDDDGDGMVTDAEFGEDFARMVAQFDRNGDGVISAEDATRKRGHNRGADQSKEGESN